MAAYLFCKGENDESESSIFSFPSLRGWPSPVDLSIHLIKDCGGGQSWILGFIKKSNYFFISKKKCKKRKQKKKNPRNTSLYLVQILA